MLYNPRVNVIDVANAVRVTSKTVSNRLKYLDQSGVIMGYFMTLDVSKFKYNTFKFFLIEYGDNHGLHGGTALGCALENGEVFNKIPNLRVSRH